MSTKSVGNGVMASLLAFLCIAASTSAAPRSTRDAAKTVAEHLESVGRKSQSNVGAERTEAIIALREVLRVARPEERQLVELERQLVNSVGPLMESDKIEDRKKAFHQIIMLGELRSKMSIPVLVERLMFQNPYIEEHDKGPQSYAAPRPRDLPAFDALARIGEDAVEAVFARAIDDDDPLLLDVGAELLVHNYRLKGALEWLDAAILKRVLSDEQRRRAQQIRGLIENRR